MSDVNQVQYQKAKRWQVLLWPISAGSSNMYMMLMMFASYMAAGGYGLAVTVAGVVATNTRMLDAVIDPFLAIIGDRFPAKYGRVRILMAIGYAMLLCGILVMFFWGVGHGLPAFIAAYLLYVIGRSIYATARDMGTPILTNEPQQRLEYGRWSVIYTLLLSVVQSMYLSKILVPKYGGLTIEAFQELALVSVIIGTIMTGVSLFAIAPYDKKENFVNIDNKPISLRDCWHVMKGNKQLWAYIVAYASDKLASQTAGQSAITTLVFGVIIGNYAFNSDLRVITMIPTILMVFYATKLRKNGDTKTQLIKWTWLSIAFAVAMVAFLAFGDPTQISVSPVYTAIFLLLYCLQAGANSVIGACTNSMIPDIVDYELYRSGKFLPSTIAAISNIVDQLISSFGATIVAFCIAAIGYSTEMPQPGDPCTTPVFWMTMFLWLGMPILGWLCTQIAMPFYKLDRKTMKEVHAKNAEIRNVVKKS